MYLKLSFLLVVSFCLPGCARFAQNPIQPSGVMGTKTGPIRITNFEECVAAGYAVTESFPPKCITPNGMQFVKPRKVVDGGVCENRCGDGVCQQIVCSAVGCPCAETPVNCAADCAAASF